MSLFRTLGNRIIEARQREARAQVNAILRHYDAETLKRAGFTREEIEHPISGTRFL